jgi:hypothetical protein
MALYCQNLLQILFELARHNDAYADLIPKFAEHFLWIASAMDHIGENQDGMWDEEDGFYYDLLRLPDGHSMRLKVRSLVGLLPLAAVTFVDDDVLKRFPEAVQQLQTFGQRHPELAATFAPMTQPGVAGRRIIPLVHEDKMRRILTKMLDENEFLSPYGIRSVSRYHQEHPYVFNVDGAEYRVNYLPAESDTGMFGGNSNWRGPVWLPMNALLIRALVQLYSYYGDDFKVECPTGSGRMMNLFEVSKEITDRLTNIFARNESGRRPVFGGSQKFQNDPHWRDLLLFYEYFHGDNGAGLGASHQTGWTGGIGKLIQLYGSLDSDNILRTGLTSARAFKSVDAEEARREAAVGTSTDL